MEPRGGGLQVALINIGFGRKKSMEASNDKTDKTVLERRSKARYPVRLTVRYRTISRIHHINGVGHTLNMSSGGLLVSGEQQVSTGLRVEINVEWPLLLDGAVPLQLVAHGKVVRCGGSLFAISFAQYQFRTMARILKAAAGFETDPVDHFDSQAAQA